MVRKKLGNLKWSEKSQRILIIGLENHSCAMLHLPVMSDIFTREYCDNLVLCLDLYYKKSRATLNKKTVQTKLMVKHQS